VNDAVATVSSRPRVVFWTPLPAPYMVERFNALADAGEIDLEVWFNVRAVEGRSWAIDESTWRFAHRYLKTHYWRTWWWGIPWPLLRKPKPDVVILLHSEPIYLVGLLIARLRGIVPCIILDGPEDGWSPRSRIKELVKRVAFRLARYTACAGPQTRDRALRYGARPQESMVLEHCVNVPLFSDVADQSRRDRAPLRTQLQLVGITFICIGGLWPRKGVEFLIDAFAIVQAQRNVECSLILAGDGELREALERKVAQLGLHNVVFAGFWQRPDLPRLHACADVMVFPTLGDTYGYVVEEAMSSGLPVIATSAAGEIHSRIQEGRTGYVVPPRDAPALAQRMLTFLDDPALAQSMGAAARQSVQSKTPQNWAKRFAEMARTMASRTLSG
jgi:glycosyltransferase involved in cell wall biosynthesis